VAEAVPRDPRLEPVGGDEFCLGFNVLTVIYAEKHHVTFRLVPGGQMTRPKWRFRCWARKAQVVRKGELRNGLN